MCGPEAPDFAGCRLRWVRWQTGYHPIQGGLDTGSRKAGELGTLELPLLFYCGGPSPVQARIRNQRQGWYVSSIRPHRTELQHPCQRGKEPMVDELKLLLNAKRGAAANRLRQRFRRRPNVGSCGAEGLNANFQLPVAEVGRSARDESHR
jgi:hypothetical protein